MDQNHKHEKIKSPIYLKSISELQSTESRPKDFAADSTDETRNSMTVDKAPKTTDQPVLRNKTKRRRETLYYTTDSTVAKRKEQVRIILT